MKIVLLRGNTDTALSLQLLHLFIFFAQKHISQNNISNLCMAVLHGCNKRGIVSRVASLEVDNHNINNSKLTTYSLTQSTSEGARN